MSVGPVIYRKCSLVSTRPTTVRRFSPQTSHESASDGLPSCYREQANSNACKVASVKTQEWSNVEAQRLLVTNVVKRFIKPLT